MVSFKIGFQAFLLLFSFRDLGIDPSAREAISEFRAVAISDVSGKIPYMRFLLTGYLTGSYSAVWHEKFRIDTLIS